MTATVTGPTTTQTLPKYLLATIGGKDFPILRTQVTPKDGDTEVHYYYTFRDPSKNGGVRWGVKVGRTQDELPTSITIDGVEVYLLKGLTAASFTERKKVVQKGKIVTLTNEVIVPEDKRRPQAASKTFQVLPSLVSETDSGLRNVDVKITETPDDLWNVKIVVNKAGVASASPEESDAAAKQRAQDVVARFDALLAEMDD